MTSDKILLGHGSGGKLSHDLIKDIFVKHFNNPLLNSCTDSALLDIDSKNLAFTTDSYVVDPVFFPGGNIGHLAVCGTVNDLAVSGATPLYLTSSFIIEEGFPVKDLEQVVMSMAKEAEKAGVKIVAGDTKVVDRGKCDKVFINTSGIGILEKGRINISYGSDIKAGDKILINGFIGDHGIAVMCARNELQFSSDIKSDCACLNGLISGVLEETDNVRFMRDATRGGVVTVLCELAETNDIGIELDEDNIPVRENVRGMCEVLGYDPLYVANEGKVVMVVPADEADMTLKKMRQDDLGRDSAIIGQVVDEYKGKVFMNTGIGGRRIVDMLAGEQLPRIC